MRYILIVFFIAAACFAQSNDDNWISIESVNPGNVYFNTKGLENFKGSDFYVWVLEEHAAPITVESVNGKISKTKTYYLFNKELKKYSFIEIYYYDNEDNVIKSFSYRRDTEVENYKYNYPVLEDSDLGKVFSKAVEYLPKEDKSN